MRQKTEESNDVRQRPHASYPDSFGHQERNEDEKFIFVIIYRI